MGWGAGLRVPINEAVWGVSGWGVQGREGSAVTLKAAHGGFLTYAAEPRLRAF